MNMLILLDMHICSFGGEGKGRTFTHIICILVWADGHTIIAIYPFIYGLGKVKKVIVSR